MTKMELEVYGRFGGWRERVKERDTYGDSVLKALVQQGSVCLVLGCWGKAESFMKQRDESA